MKCNSAFGCKKINSHFMFRRLKARRSSDGTSSLSCRESRVLSPGSPTRPRRQKHCRRERRLRGGRGGPAGRHPLSEATRVAPLRVTSCDHWSMSASAGAADSPVARSLANWGRDSSMAYAADLAYGNAGSCKLKWAWALTLAIDRRRHDDVQDRTRARSR